VVTATQTRQINTRLNMQNHISPHVRLSQGFSPSFEDRFWNNVFIVPYDRGCWLWFGCRQKHKRDYGKIERGARGIGSILAHVASWFIHCGPVPDGLCVLHKCDNPPCVNPAHLFLGTRRDNAHDAMAKDRHSRGERNGVSKLTDAATISLINLWNSGCTQVELSDRFKVSQQVVSKIVNRQLWKHLKIQRPRQAWRHTGQLKPEQVLEIRRLYSAGGISMQAVADKFNICQQSVSLIVNLKIWKHLTI
jgi:hypothetical protein